MRRLFFALFFTLLVIDYGYSSEKLYSGLMLTSDNFKGERLPNTTEINSILREELGYFESLPATYRIDVNSDGIPDYLIESETAVCGTGGCVYDLIDGKSLLKIGEFFGGPPIISDSKVNRYSVILMLKYGGRDKATLEVYEYTGHTYEPVKEIKLIGEDLTNQLQRFRKVNDRTN